MYLLKVARRKYILLVVGRHTYWYIIFSNKTDLKPKIIKILLDWFH